MTHWQPVAAGYFIQFVLLLFNFDAMVVPWGRIYIVPRRMNDAELIAHEFVHVAQIRRDGHLLFWTRCVWWFVAYGYVDSPYEVEARRIAADVAGTAAGRARPVDWKAINSAVTARVGVRRDPDDCSYNGPY